MKPLSQNTLILENPVFTPVSDWDDSGFSDPSRALKAVNPYHARAAGLSIGYIWHVRSTGLVDCCLRLFASLEIRGR
jgi:hypothetical protein